MNVIRLSLLVLAVSLPVVAQDSASTATLQQPQSARQALIEMFTGKGENDFKKHLPEDTRQMLIHKGDSEETSTVLRIGMIGRQLTAQGGKFETFAEGRILLASEPNESHEKFEVIVERDSLMGEQDEIELSINYYKDGEVQWMPVIPRVTFTLQQEKDIWRLVEVSGTARVPLTDPDYLKGLRKEQNDSNQQAARSRVIMMAMSEKGYADKHPDRGYACTLADLWGQNQAGQASQDFGYDPGQGTEEWSGYHYAISGCDGPPATKFRITAIPLESDANLKMFCADQTGTVKSIDGTGSSSCLSHGDVENGTVPMVSKD